MLTAIFILMALLIAGLGSYILFQKAKEEAKSAQIMQPKQYNYYGMPNPVDNLNNYRREINSSQKNSSTETLSPNTNKIKIEIEQTNQDQNQIQINIDPKAKNNTVDTTIKNSPKLVDYQRKLIDNQAHRPSSTAINRNNGFNRFGSATSAHNRGNRRSSFNRFNSTAPVNQRSNQTASSTSAKAMPLYTPSENKAHKPTDNKKLFVPQKQQTITKPPKQQTITKPKAVKPDAKQQKVIDSLNKEKDKIIKQSSDKSTNSDNTKETAKKTEQRKSILDKYSNRSSIEIKKEK